MKQNYSNHADNPRFHLHLLPEQQKGPQTPALCRPGDKTTTSHRDFACRPQVLLDRAVPRWDQGSFQPSSQCLTAAKPQTKTEYIVIPAKLFLTTISPKQEEQEPAAPRSCTLTLQIVCPMLQPSTTSSSRLPCRNNPPSPSLPLPRSKPQVQPWLCCWGAPGALGDTAPLCVCVLGPGLSPRKVPVQKGWQCPRCLLAAQFCPLCKVNLPAQAAELPGTLMVRIFKFCVLVWGCDPQVTHKTLSTSIKLHPFQQELSQLPGPGRSSIPVCVSHHCMFCVSWMYNPKCGYLAHLILSHQFLSSLWYFKVCFLVFYFSHSCVQKQNINRITETNLPFLPE